MNLPTEAGGIARGPLGRQDMVGPGTCRRRPPCSPRRGTACRSSSALPPPFESATAPRGARGIAVGAPTASSRVSTGRPRHSRARPRAAVRARSAAARRSRARASAPPRPRARARPARPGNSGPCSAWPTRSAATISGSAVVGDDALPMGRRTRRCRHGRTACAWPPRRSVLPGPTMMSAGLAAEQAEASAATPARRPAPDGVRAAGLRVEHSRMDPSPAGRRHATTFFTPARPAVAPP